MNEFGCIYLAESVKSLKLASKYFSSLYEEDMDAFLAIHHKAWNSLWQADLVFNGISIRKKNGFLYGIENVMQKSSSVGSDYPLNYSRLQTIAFKDFEHSDPFFENVNLFKLLRNQSVHEHMNTKKFRDFCIPFLRASFFNYVARYNQIYSLVKSNSSKIFENQCHGWQNNHDCSINSIPSGIELSHTIVIPTSLYALKVERDEMAISDESRHQLPDSIQEKIIYIIRKGYENERNNPSEYSRFSLAYTYSKHEHKSLHANSRFKYSTTQLVEVLQRDDDFPFVIDAALVDKAVIKHFSKTIRLGSVEKIDLDKSATISFYNETTRSDDCVKKIENEYVFSEIMVSLIKEKSFSIDGKKSKEKMSSFLDVNERDIKEKEQLN